jgi:hypothetical protein
VVFRQGAAGDRVLRGVAQDAVEPAEALAVLADLQEQLAHFAAEGEVVRRLHRFRDQDAQALDGGADLVGPLPEDLGFVLFALLP